MGDNGSGERRWVRVLLLVGIAALAGCNRAGPAVVKSLGAVEREGVRTVGRGVTKAEQAAVKPRWQQRAGKFVGKHADDIAEPALDWAKAQMPSEPAETRFPVHLLQANPATAEYSPDGRFCFMENNYGGANGYDARTGRLVMFTAVHRETGQMHYFNAAGYRTR